MEAPREARILAIAAPLPKGGRVRGEDIKIWLIGWLDGGGEEENEEEKKERKGTSRGPCDDGELPI